MIAADPARLAEVELQSCRLQRKEYMRQAKEWRRLGSPTNVAAWLRAARVWHRRVLEAKRAARSLAVAA